MADIQMGSSPSLITIHGVMTADILAKFVQIKSFRLPRHLLLFLKFGAMPFVAGALAWSGLSILLLPMALVLPMTLSVATSRWMALGGAMGYYAGTLWPVIPSSTTFLSQPSLASGIILWLIWSLILAAPFYLVGVVRHSAKATVTLLMILAEAVSPIGVGSPVISAGVLFPTMGIFGLLGISILILGLSERAMWFRGLIVITALMLFTMLFSPTRNYMPGWSAHDTHFVPPADYQWGQYGRVMSMIADHNRSGSIVSVFPENVVPGWSDLVSDQMIQMALKAYVPEAHTIVFGAERINRGERIPIVLARGFSTDEYIVRIPVPIAEWGNDVPLNMFGHSTIKVNGLRVGVLICYEQLLVLPVLQSVYSGAAVLVAPSNLYWARGDAVSNAQDVCVRAWSRLFNLPYYRSVNR